MQGLLLLALSIHFGRFACSAWFDDINDDVEQKYETENVDALLHFEWIDKHTFGSVSQRQSTEEVQETPHRRVGSVKYIPPYALRQGLETALRQRGEQVRPGRGSVLGE